MKIKYKEKSGRLKLKQVVMLRKKSQAHGMEAQALPETKKCQKCEKMQKAVRWMLNPRPLGYQRAALPLGWPYIH